MGPSSKRPGTCTSKLRFGGSGNGGTRDNTDTSTSYPKPGAGGESEMGREYRTHVKAHLRHLS
jgi:hypothetical protein